MHKFVKSASFAVILIAATAVTTASAGTFVVTGPLGGTTTVTHVPGDTTFSHVPAVSEADTLSLMAVGLGLIGLRLRLKNK